MRKQILLATAVTLAAFQLSAHAQNIMSGDFAPNFTLDQFGGGSVSLDGYPGKVIFINFFGST